MSPPRPDEIRALKAELESCLNEDPVNREWALERIDRLGWSVGAELYSGLLLQLFNLSVGEDEARRLWETVRAHRAALEATLGRPVAFRVAALDHLVELNRRAPKARLLEVLETHRPSPGEMIDPITGLHTATFMQDVFPRELGRARRFKLELSLVHIEIDDFPALAERLGQSMGTVLMKELAGILCGSIRTIDYAGRMSAATFALILTETDRMGAYYVADRIRQQVEEFHLERRVDGRPFDVTVSSGIASFPQDADGPEELVAKARDAFYTARARGPGRVAIHYRERREFIRLSPDTQELQVTLAPKGARGASELAPVSMKNISSGGVLFESAVPIEIGRGVQIACRNRRDSDEVLIPGRVVRIEAFEAEEGMRYEIGVLFDLVVEEQLEGVIDFLERFIAVGSAPAAGEDEPGRSPGPRGSE
ncbi:MAG TPA: diguanylate cyclase [Candidatus Polarisedimenticolia bacterium]|nr:diguanylate cyclase [Candidatus Polarisedimenticolia bacterium]